jgi:hypothetical protein
MRVDAPSADEARRTAQELAELSTVLFNDRFGPATVASIWEAPRAQPDAVSPRPGRNVLLGLAAGSLAGLGAALLARPRRRRVAGPPWTVGELRRLVSGATAVPPERREEWRRLVDAMSEFAGPRGQLPRRLDQLVEAELGELLSR